MGDISPIPAGKCVTLKIRTDCKVKDKIQIIWVFP